MTEPKRFCVIVNERAGDLQGPDSRTELLRGHLAQAGLDAHLRSPAGGQTLDALAHEALAAGHEILVAAGGDGTISAVAAACHAHDAPMGVLPQGTFNYFARGLNIPEEVDAAIATLSDGQLRDVHLGEVNGQIFLNNASLGLYPAILDRREDIYRRWGRSRLAAYWSVAATLAGVRRAMRLSLEIDGKAERLRTPLAFVANSAYQLEQFNLEGADEVRHGQFALFLSQGESRFDLVRAAFGLAVGTPRNGEDFALRYARDITVDTGRARVLVARDGEKQIMLGPLRFRKRRRPLKVIVPRSVVPMGAS